MGQHEPEPYLVVTVRELIKDLRDDMNERFKELAGKLDDRVTIGVFNALRSDLDNALRRLGKVEQDLTAVTERDKGAWWAAGKIGAGIYALTVTGLAIWGLVHG